MSEATREYVIEKSRQIIKLYVNRVKSFEAQNDYLSIEGQSLINNYSFVSQNDSDFHNIMRRLHDEIK